MATDDFALLDAWAEGDRDAGNALLLAHFDALYRFFRTKTNSEGDADDMIQQTFLACVESRDKFRRQSSFRTYILAVARNELFGYLRKRQRAEQRNTPLGSMSVAELDSSASSALARRAEERLLLDALSRIPVDLQLAIELHYWEGLKMAELAVVLDIPTGTVKSRLRRAREALEAAMKTGDAERPMIANTIADFEKWAAAVRDRISPGG